MAQWFKVSGGGTPDAERPEGNYYPTPPLVTRALLRRETFPSVCWEPAGGSGHMVDVLREFAGLDVFATDINPRRADVGQGDFIAPADSLLTPVEPPTGLRSLVTNPPFPQALAFAQRAVALGDVGLEKFALLLRFQFVESVERHEFFTDPRSMPSRVWVFSNRVQVSELGLSKPLGGMIPYAWFVWDLTVRDGRCELKWIRVNEGD